MSRKDMKENAIKKLLNEFKKLSVQEREKFLNYISINSTLTDKKHIIDTKFTNGLVCPHYRASGKGVYKRGKSKLPKTYSAPAVANYIIGHASSVTNLKLQKMLYYIQGFALARWGHILFHDCIEAWTYGPVVPTVYDLFKEHGANPIRRTVPAEDITNPYTQQFLDGLIRTMEQYSGAQLVELTHKTGTPWSQVWGKGEGRFGIIPTEMIRQYFSTHITA